MTCHLGHGQLYLAILIRVWMNIFLAQHCQSWPSILRQDIPMIGILNETSLACSDAWRKTTVNMYRLISLTKLTMLKSESWRLPPMSSMQEPKEGRQKRPEAPSNASSLKTVWWSSSRWMARFTAIWHLNLLHVLWSFLCWRITCWSMSIVPRSRPVCETNCSWLHATV